MNFFIGENKMKKSIFMAAAVLAALGLSSCYNSAPDDVPYVYVNGGQIGGGSGGSSETSSGTGGGDSSGGQQQGGQSGDNSARGSYVDTSTNEALRNYLVGNWAVSSEGGIISGTISFNADGTGHVSVQNDRGGAELDNDFSWSVDVINDNGMVSWLYISGTESGLDERHSLGTTWQNQFYFYASYLVTKWQLRRQ